MSSIKEFNEILNNSTKNRFENWETYRNQITSFLLEKMAERNSKFNNVLIIGAGKCDDLDLNILNKNAKNLYLSDIDLNSMKSAFGKYGLKRDDSKILKIDYTGLEENSDWNDIVKLFLKSNNIKEIKNIITSIFYEVKNYRFLDEFKTKFDLIIVTPIYTQLLLQQFLSNMSILESLNYSKDLIQYALDVFLDKMPELIDRFNRNILDLLEKTGMIFIISDIFETKMNSEDWKELHSQVNDSKKMETFYKTYSDKYGVGLGDFGLLNMLGYLKENSNRWFEWPFTDERIIFVKAIEIRR